MRIFVVIALLAGSAAVGVANADVPMEPDLRWARYPQHQPVSSAESLSVDGQERALAYFVTADDPLTVTEWYEARWGTVGFRIHRTGEGAVTGDDGVERRTVVATSRGRDTMVLLSRRILEERSVSVSAPIPDGCEPVHHSASRDRSGDREFVTLRCTMDGPTVVEHFENDWGRATERLNEGSRGFARFDGNGDATLLYQTREFDGEPVSYVSVRSESTP